MCLRGGMRDCRVPAGSTHPRRSLSSYVGFLKILWSHGAVMRRCVVFCEVVGEIFLAGCPENAKLALVDAATAAADPAKSHVDGAQSTLFDGVVGDTIGG